jgi:hypothetical protein
MDSTLTIRLPKEQRMALKKRAAEFHKTESDWIRSLIAHDLANASLLERIQHLVGSLDSSSAKSKPHSFEKTLKERNWRS